MYLKIHNSESYTNIQISSIAYTTVYKITALQTKIIRLIEMFLESYFLSQQVVLSYSSEFCCDVQLLINAFLISLIQLKKNV